ncbi:hypothetical protein Pcinc_009603 [Petrolisthes cinctipes]|uniref:Uncharacterized protein n=1 Tax=Petrolisthes cinctipes TaxID=88211 RepID=A0AAE1G6P5_PETCI|nr:hypothetical protein Pcinc_009603 [Petrolisthes cinctipes]
MGTLFVIPWALGYILVPGIAYILKGNWRWLQLAYSLPTTLFIVYFVWLPESPRWLITQARFQEALKVLKWAAKVNRNTLPSDEVILDAMTYIEKQTLLERSKEEMEAPKEISCLRSEEEKEEELKERSCQRSEEEEELKETSYQRSKEEEPKERSRQKNEEEVDELKERSCQRSEELNEEERKESLCIFSVMALMLIQLNELVVVVLSLSGKVAITATCQLIWAYTSELYPTKVRSLALGEANFLASLGSLCSPYINDLLGEVVVWGPSALFGLVSLVAAALALILPETRHSDLQEALKH